MANLHQTREAYGQALRTLGELNDKVVVLDADLYNSTRTVLFRDKFAERFIDMGIAEADMVSTAAGMAASGLIPYCNSFAIFLTARCYDQIRIQIAYPKLHVVLAGSSAGLTQGQDGASHQSLEDVALMRALPNMMVLVPADGTEAEAMTLAAAEIDGPVYLRLGRYPVPDLVHPNRPFQFGKAEVLRSGDTCSLLACAHMVQVALEAADILAAKGVKARVVNVSTVKPLDQPTVIDAASGVPVLITIEEHSIIGGLGSAVAEVLAGAPTGARLVRLGTPDVFGESGTADQMLNKYHLTPSAVAERALAELARPVKRGL
ncbi:MAG: transketolase family protein [Chloroflexi bacterium]|nr:transketolase family protein [Chloroflexota bacterium]